MFRMVSRWSECRRGRWAELDRILTTKPKTEDRAPERRTFDRGLRGWARRKWCNQKPLCERRSLPDLLPIFVAMSVR